MSEQHGAVDACGLAERYLTGGLDDEETQRFEEHYLHCARCLEQLELDEALRGALREAAARDALTVGRPLAVLAWLSRLSRSRQAAVLAGALVVALALPLIFEQRRLAGVARERDAARAALAEAEAHRRAGSGAAAAARRSESERARREAEEQWRLAGLLERESRARAALERRLARAVAPQANTPVLRLSPLRSLGGEPADRLRLRPDAGWVVLSLELASADYPSYRVSLKRTSAPSAPVWSHASLVPNAEGSLALSLHASTLVSGDYEAVVEGLASDGSGVSVGRFTFRVRRSGE